MDPRLRGDDEERWEKRPFGRLRVRILAISTNDFNRAHPTLNVEAREEMVKRLEPFLDGLVKPDHDEGVKRANTRFAPT